MAPAAGPVAAAAAVGDDKPMAEDTSEKSERFDGFELAVAILLGLAAIGAAWGDFQSGQWNGLSVEAYGEASTMATKASTEHHRAEMDIAHDDDCDVQAKGHILEALDSTNDADRARLLHMASYLYAVEMSEAGYAAMKLPAEYHTGGDIKKHEGIPFDALKASLDTRLGPDYENRVLEKAVHDEQAADHRFDEGRAESSTGDRFDLDSVIFTVSLFFAGLGLVFKSRVRWTFFFAGVLVFLAAATYLMRTPWA